MIGNVISTIGVILRKEKMVIKADTYSRDALASLPLLFLRTIQREDIMKTLRTRVFVWIGIRSLLRTRR